MPVAQAGGGAKKILYTLATVNRIGVAKAAKALTAHNTCKACALGMGGQKGGMTNELGEFPAVCNKSVQAQSTDIQDEIPVEVFDHPTSDFRDLTPRETERLGRLGFPVLKRKGEDRFSRISWDDAMAFAAERFQATDPSRSFFYSSGRSSNEAGFVLQLLARLYGTNNVNNCSYYCHQATGVALGSTIGTGTSTVELADLTRADLIFVIGANPSSNHPRFIHQLRACRERGGEVIVINPAKEPGLQKFALPKSPKSLLSGGSDIASLYVQPKIGEDMALFKGIAKAVLEQKGEAQDFLTHQTEGAEHYIAAIKALSWDEITRRCGVAQPEIEKLAGLYLASENAVFAWGMGMTHHLHGVQNIEEIAALALLRGMIGRPGAGLLPLRGHSNVQGIGTIGVKPVLAEDVVQRIEARFGVSLPEETGMDTMACMQAAHAGEMEAALIMGGNLYAANPNSEFAREALDRIGFKLFLTTTLNQGHFQGCEAGDVLILPVTARDEEWEPTTQESMFNYVRLSDGGIKRFDGVRPESRILSDLGQRILPDLPFDFEAFGRHASVRKAIAEVLPELDELKEIEVAKREFHIKGRLLHKPDFKTTSGKARFQVNSLPPVSSDRPFTLATLRSEGQFNSIIYEEKDSYRGTPHRWVVMMNAEDIERLGKQEGETVDLVSEAGRMEAVEIYAFDVPEGNLLAYYPEANVLTATEVDPRSKTPAFKSVKVSVDTTA
ncbi:MAG: histidine kinase [Ponticaulis sp.]|nr:histidine kinase [Ponticaulis sp.]|tara:strand:+ start:20617 stop:22791 length:2175 start_codon:yes stop_codon:yes gene_type:complete